MITQSNAPASILLVEDDRAHVALIRRFFESCADEFALRAVHTLADAERVIAGEAPALAFVDFFLPDGDGLSLVRENERFPVVILTSQGSEQLAVEAMRAGALDYVVKSEALFADMPHVARRALREWRHIADRRRAEQELRASETRFRTMLEAVAEGILLVDRTGRILMANDFAAGIFRTTRDALIGLEVDALLPEGLRELHQRHRAQYAQEQTPRPRGIGLDVVARRLDGTTFPAEVSLTPLTVDGEEVVMCFLVDITGRKQLEEERLYARALEVELEKEREIIELREHFMSMVSHEFRAPLAVVLATSQLLQAYQGKITTEQVREQMGRIAAQTHQMLDLLDDILILSRANAGKLECLPEPLDVAALCKHVLDEFRVATHSSHPIQFDPEPVPADCLVDPVLLTRVLNNLLRNAASYSPEGSPIDLALSVADGWLMLSVTDSGMGIPVEEQARVFEPFHRARNAARIPGTGLGLAIVKRNVAAHGGTVTLHSAPGRGSTFVIRLPLQTLSDRQDA